MTEFAFIKKFLTDRAGERQDVVLGIGDDCALLQPPAGELLAVSTDTLVENVHFFANTAAEYIGHKALAVSLSDLAAMGAKPAWVLLALTLPSINESWLQAFCDGFFALSSRYALQLVGGNTSRGPLSVTTQVMGFVPQALALRRDGAKPGDLIYVTGNLGTAGLALRWLKQADKYPIRSSATQAALIAALSTPEPRVAVGIALRGIASAAIDISDGLISDLQHILEESGVGASIKTENLPISSLVESLITDAEAYELALTAGDDYELCFTVNPQHVLQLNAQFKQLNCAYQCIGKIERLSGLRIFNRQGEKVNMQQSGYVHFLE